VANKVPSLGAAISLDGGKVHTRVAPSLLTAIILDGGKVHTRVAPSARAAISLNRGRVHTQVAPTPSLGAAINLDGGKVHTRVANKVPSLGATVISPDEQKNTPEWQSTSPTLGQRSLVSLVGFIGHFSLVGRCIFGFIESAVLPNHWPLGFIGIISLGLIASSASTASTASLTCWLISFVSLVGSSTHWLFCKRLTTAIIKATNIDLNGLNCLNGLNSIIGLVGFGLNCLDNFNGIIGLVGFGLIGCIGFIVGIIGLNVLVKLVSLVGLFNCISEPAFDLNFNYRSVVSKLNYLAQGSLH
jgi:hypothetical protein